MDVILLEKVPNLGNLGDKVSIRPGFGRNYLIPQGKAVPATPSRIAEFEQRRAELEKKAAAELASAQARLDRLTALEITIAQKAGEEGRLYGSVGTKDIADAAAALGVELRKSEVRLPEGPLRHTGDFQIAVQLHGDVMGHITVTVVPE
jgi:large subunit ribosomal protein L9